MKPNHIPLMPLIAVVALSNGCKPPSSERQFKVHLSTFNLRSADGLPGPWSREGVSRDVFLTFCLDGFNGEKALVFVDGMEISSHFSDPNSSYGAKCYSTKPLITLLIPSQRLGISSRINLKYGDTMTFKLDLKMNKIEIRQQDKQTPRV